MARDQKPVTDAEIEAAREEMAAQREEVREHLAAELGGDPEDYDSTRYFQQRDDEPDRSGEAVTDGGE